MNYAEWVMEWGKMLWREREKMLEERLALPLRTGEGETEKRQQDAEKTMQQKRGMEQDRVQAPGNAAEKIGVNGALARLAQKLGILEKTADGENGEGSYAAFTMEEGIRQNVPERVAANDRSSGAAWLQERFEKDGAEGAAAAEKASREKTIFSLAREQEERETESFSLSLERDARRYDGGFLYY